MPPTRSISMTLTALCVALALCGCGQTGTASAPAEQATTTPIGAPITVERAVTSDPGSRTLPFADPIGGITVETDPMRGVPGAATQPTYVDPLEMAPMPAPLPATKLPATKLPATNLPAARSPTPQDPASPTAVTTAPPSRGLPLTGSGALPPPVDPSGR